MNERSQEPVLFAENEELRTCPNVLDEDKIHFVHSWFPH